MKIKITILLFVLSISSFAQKKVLDHSDVDRWNVIKNKTISSNGAFVMYSLERGEKDNFLKIKDSKGNLVFDYHRGEKGVFTENSENSLFTIKPWKDSIVELKRKKIKKDNLPKDSLGIFNLKEKSLVKIANVKSYKLPIKWNGYVAYLLDADKVSKKVKDPAKNDSVKKTAKKKTKKVGKENGYHLVVRDLRNHESDTLKYVTDYHFAKEAKRLVFSTSGIDSSYTAGVYLMNLEQKSLNQIFHKEKGKFHQLSISNSGEKVGFIMDADTTKVQIRPYELYTWSEGNETAFKKLDTKTSPNGYMVSSNGKLYFSKDESKLYFGLSTPPIVKDTTLIDEEIVNVEVWTYDEPRLYTVQELQVKNDQKKSYTSVLHLRSNKVTQIATTHYPNAIVPNEGDSNFAVVSTTIPYELESQWKGYKTADYALVNLESGNQKQILSKLAGRVQISPQGKFVYGYNSVDSTWFTFSIKDKKLVELTKGRQFYDEMNDSPKHPGSYGSAGWMQNDAAVLFYDRYDIWKFNPETGASNKLTNGRDSKVTYRYLKLDKEERFISNNQKLLLRTFNEINKHSGFYKLDLKSGEGKQLLQGPYNYGRPVKAINENALIFTRESFTEFPDIRYSNLSFKKEVLISDANPQQDEYNWGTAELVHWTSLDGIELSGMLIKPENFDSSKKYPMIVNFYEKSSDRLFNHRAPSWGRSTINYSFYTSRGYVIFNPDVHYRIGYPGESSFNCVIPGVTSLIEQGFVDKENIGVQGHSWGGYQIAYLVTKTDIFKAAESGAPVPNMISAYGGIRWWSGLSRQFQYEHTQSRIGGTPWEYPARYIENSPIFNIDKINTPLLIMHNDEDGHVPWYQGIEFFVALRRQGKPSWFLNYNGEPHWPVKLQNRIDFNKRLSQFFDFYLKGAQKPIWMERGVPAVEKGIHQGLELMPKTN